MKRIIGLLVFILLAGTAFGQSVSQSNVPAVVLNAFQLKFPNADDVKWKLEKGNYRVNYKVHSKVHRYLLDNKGKVLKHMQDLYVSEIPEAVLETLQSKAPYYDLHDADRL